MYSAENTKRSPKQWEKAKQYAETRAAAMRKDKINARVVISGTMTRYMSIVVVDKDEEEDGYIVGHVGDDRMSAAALREMTDVIEKKIRKDPNPHRDKVVSLS